MYSPGRLSSSRMYGARALRSAVWSLPNASLSSLQRCVAGQLSVGIASQRTFATRTDFSETVYDNEDGGPKCRGIELLRDPNFNKASILLLVKSTVKYTYEFIIALYYKPFISKVLRYGPCVTRGSHSFTCHPHMNYTSLPSFKR